MSASVGTEKEVVKIKAELWERVMLLVFFLFVCVFSQTITNFGSDDILILSLWVCETTPSVCFPLIRVIAANITATVPHDKLLHANVWRLFGVWWTQLSNYADVSGQHCCILLTTRASSHHSQVDLFSYCIHCVVLFINCILSSIYLCI